MKDLVFISGDFFETEIHKDNRYLLKYFRTQIQRAFLKYYLVFENVSNFTNHTGIYCVKGYLIKLEYKLKRIREAHKQAKANMDFDILWKIEKGKFKLIDKV